MERVMQYLDDLEDLVCALVLAAGRIARAIAALVGLVLSVAIALGIVALTLLQPPLGLASATMLSVILLYRAVVSGTVRRPQLLDVTSSAEGQLQPR
jgi:membrane protein implicated in regulation of membrane protease activity